MKKYILFHILLLSFVLIHAQNQIVGYQYAFNDGQGVTYVPITPTTDFHLQTDIDVSSLTNTVNQFHIRFIDNNGQWSGIISNLFLRIPEVTQSDKKIVGYEYYFNDDSSNRIYTAVSPQDDFHLISDIDVSSLSNTVNAFHIRFKDDAGQWSGIISNLFLRIPQITQSDKKIVGYEYYFNDDSSNRIYTSISPQDDFHLISDIDVSSLSNTVNAFHIRFKDNTGQWSGMSSNLFLRIPQITQSDKKIVGYEYYFNNDSSNRIYTSVSPQDDFHLISDIDVNILANSLNTLHIRFKDNHGEWSGIVNKMFLRVPQSDIQANNNLMAYEYWFDNDRSNLKTIVINPTQHDILIAELDMNHIWRGERILHTRFKDIYGNYSGITTDTITKLSRPLAKFNAGTTLTCTDVPIQFTDQGSIDYDTYEWNFGDGTTSHNLNETHSYSSSGTYTVSLTVTDTNINVSNTMQQQIIIEDYPSNTVSISGNNPACYNDTVTLTADATGMNYLWSTGETTQHIDVTTAGTYSVQISKPTGAQCSVQSNNIQIDFYPQIDTSITVNNNPVELVANQANATYQWVDCNNGNSAITDETHQTFTPTISGSYAVEVTSNGCTEISNCETVTVVSIDNALMHKNISLHPNPVINQLIIDTKIQKIQIDIFSIDGSLVISTQNNNATTNINISNLKKGLYLTKITALSGALKGSSVMYRIIKR